MSAPPLELPSSHSTSGHQDGLGWRTLCFDREDGLILERLQVRPELRAFEAALRERMESASRFEDERFARVRSIEHDPGGNLTVVSEFVAGNRICDLLDAASGLAAEEATSLSVDAALGFLLEILPALTALHTVAGFTHGAVGPDRTVLTPTGQVVLLDSIFGHTLERLHFNRRRLWHELRIAAPASAGPARFDIAADLGQASLTALMIVIGRHLKDTEYPDGLAALVTEVVEIAQIRGSASFASGLHSFLQHTLPLPGRKPYTSAEQAAAELRELAREIGIQRCRTALIAFIEDMNRNLAIEPPDAADRSASEVSLELELDLDLDSESTDVIELEAEPIDASDPYPFDDLIIPSAPAPDTFELELAPEESLATEPEAPAEEVVAAEEFAAEEFAAEEFVAEEFVAEEFVAEESAAEEEAAPAGAFQYETIEVFTSMEPEVPETMVAEPESPAVTFEPEAVEEPVLAFEAFEPPAGEPEPVPAPFLAAESDAGAGMREIELVRERFALEAMRVAEPTIAFDDTFPDPRIQPPAAGPLLTLQQETAAWRASVVAADEASEPEPVPVVAAPRPEPAPEPEPPAAISARKRKRGAKADRDKLRSNAVTRQPLIVPPPVFPMPTLAPPDLPMPTPLFVQPVAPVYGRPSESTYGRSMDPLRPDPAIQVKPAPVPQAAPAVAAPSIGVRVKTELPSGYKPMPVRPDRYSQEPRAMTALPYVQRGAPENASSFPWKITAAVVLLVAGVGAGVAYWPARAGKPAAVVPTTTAKPAPAAAAAILAGGAPGSIVITTQPAGARVLLDGRPAGVAPITLDGVSPGRHTLTFITPSGSVKKSVQVAAGKALSLDVPVGSGWVAVFAPITLDISENGKAIGSTDQGRLMLSPGRHELTLSNREFGYSVVQTVEIEPAEERSINVLPMGELNVNAEPFAEVWINGKKIGDTPLGRLPMPLGTHEILFKHPQFGERRRTTVITATTPVMVSVDFTKP